MSRKKIVIIFILLFVALAIYVVARPREILGVALQKISVSASDYSWTITPAGTDTSGNPKVAVALLYKNKSYPAGMYTGNCRALGITEPGIGSERKDNNEITRVQCWFAGFGDEIGVFQEKNGVVLKKGELQEGGPESPFFRGNWRTIMAI